MFVRIRRVSAAYTVAVGTAVAGSSSIAVEHYAGAVVVVSGLTATARLTVWGSVDGTTFGKLHGSNGQPATVAVPATPAAVDITPGSNGRRILKNGGAGWPRFLRLVADTPVANTATVTVALKS